MNALRMHSRRFGVLTIARRHPRLFSRLLCLEIEPCQPQPKPQSSSQMTPKTSETPCPTQKQ
jgi:hypothetical protein